jgi:NADH-quinone oxidoreductase subunit E
MSKEQEQFSFNKENLKKAKDIVAKYPEGRQKSAMLPLLDIAQRQNDGWLSVPAIEYVANYISEPYMRAYEVASFYTMYNLKPVGKHHIQVCGTTPCWLNGAEKILESFEKHTKTKCGSTSKDGLFTISEVECLGACVNAPMAQINDDYYENLDPKKLGNLVKELKAKKA